MKAIETKIRTGPDGVISLKVPCGLADTTLDVLIVLQPRQASPMEPVADTEAWKRFVAETAGSITDPTFVRHDQGKYEDRESWS